MAERFQSTYLLGFSTDCVGLTVRVSGLLFLLTPITGLGLSTFFDLAAVGSLLGSLMLAFVV